MNELEQLLNNKNLPQATDITHVYRLRRCLLNSSFFEENHSRAMSDYARFLISPKLVLLTATVGVVVLIGALTFVVPETRDADHKPQMSVYTPSSKYGNTLQANAPSVSDLQNLIKQASQKRNGRLILETEDGSYVYNFKDDGTMQVLEYTPAYATVSNTQLISSK